MPLQTKMHSFETFTDLCSAQDVELTDTSIELAGYTGVPPKEECFTPTGVLSAIAAAGNTLRRLPFAKLATRPVTVPADYARDIGLRTLAQIVNASVEPVRAGTGMHYFACENAKFIDACSDAEATWASALDDLQYTSRTAAFDVIEDGDEPILVRKLIGEPSALSLRDVNINGVPYPAGSILRTDFMYEAGWDGYDIKEFGQQRLEQQSLKPLPIESVTRAAFIRLSAFAFPVSERSVFMPAYEEDGRSIQSLVAEMTLEDIENVAAVRL